MRFNWFTPILILSLAGCSPSQTQSTLNLKQDDDAERNFKPHYLALATGDAKGPGTDIYPWPVPALSIGHTNASYQNYGGSPYFHHGLDIRADAGTPVYASAGGKVVNIENYVPGDPAYWEVAILDANGYLWQYHHIDRGSIPQAIFQARTSGQPIAGGTLIGEVYYWSVDTFGERFHHIHLNVLGAGKRYVSPFLFLEPLDDTQAPEVTEIALLKDGRRVNSNQVSGTYSLLANVRDLIMHQRFIVPPHLITVELDGAPAQTVWSFDTLPGGESTERYVNNFYVPSETCGDYECRNLVVNLGFMPVGAREFPRALGSHEAKIVVRDFAGNSSEKTFTWSVR